ncbi:MAG: GbsR/MarR family transcriptional regulator [Nanobdellota archaeon]
MKPFEKEIYWLVESIMKDFGMDSLSGKIFVTLFLSPTEVALDALAKKTEYSLSSVSTKMRIFEQTGLAKRIKKPGSKKVYYHMEKDMVALTRHKLYLSLEREIKPLKSQLPDIIKRHKKTITESGDERQKQKLQTIEKMLTDIKHIEKAIRNCVEQL